MLHFLSSKDNQIPWTASLYSQCLGDSVFQCLNVPSQCKMDYKFDLPFHHSGYMNSHQKIIFFSVYVAYIFSFLNLSMEYRRLFERCASDANRIASPILKVSELEALCNHVIETTALREKMTPSSEHAFIFHELVEIVHHLSLFGIIKSMMCFFGERTMHTIAAGVPEGGLTYIKTVTDRFVAKENAFDHNMISYTENLKRFLNNQGRFSPKVLKLHGKFVELSLNSWVKSVLFDDVADFLVSQTIEKVSTKSPFMRLYPQKVRQIMVEVNNARNANRKRPREFPAVLADWIRELYLRFRSAEQFFFLTVKHLVNDVLFELPNDTLCEECHRLGNVFISDFAGIITDLAQFATAGEHRIAAFTHATVKGVEHRGRGQFYSENSLGTHPVLIRTHVPQNVNNVLSRN
jgi:hypothetical protein